MSNQFLTFTLHDELYAVDAMAVREMHYLPELKHIEESPPFIAGVYNLRGRIVPVIDMHILFGRSPEKYSLRDRVIVLESKGLMTGMIVNDAHDVIAILPEDIEPVRMPHYKPHAPHFISGEAKVGEDIAMVLNLNMILEFGPENLDMEAAEDEEINIQNPKFDGLTPEEKKIFRERAINLMQPAVSEDLIGLMPVAVIGLGKEYFGAELETVREFADMHDVVPIPCCPAHITGNMNLRGDILTLIDIRGALNLPLGNISASGKVIVTRIGELFAGVPVDEVFDVRYVNPSEISEAPSAIQAKNEEFIKGTAPYGGRMMTILNLSKILTREDLVVNEEA